MKKGLKVELAGKIAVRKDLGESIKEIIRPSASINRRLK